MRADLCVQNALNYFAGEIGNALDSNVMAIIGPILYGAEQKVRDATEAIASESGTKKDRLAIVLQTGGGVAEIVERMVDILRHHFAEIHFIIPDVAMSAGTIFAMSGDAIWMDYSSGLGPIDPQIERDGKLVAALSYVAQFEELKEKARRGDLTTPELILLQKLDLADLHSYIEAKQLSVALLEDWLTKYKFKDWTETEQRKVPVTDDMKRQRAREIAEQLNDHRHWHSHGRTIAMQVLRDRLRLKINDLSSDPKVHQNVRTYYGLLFDFMAQMKHRHVVHTIGLYL